MTHPLAVYIHWPFCLSKCPYCDFNSYIGRLGDSVDRSAEFVRALRLAWPDGRLETVQESIAGWLVWPGDKGFGYDPFFRPIDSPHTFGELDWTQKNAISHRSRAIRALIEKVTK